MLNLEGERRHPVAASGGPGKAQLSKNGKQAGEAVFITEQEA